MLFWSWFPQKEEYPIDGKSILFLKKVFDIEGREIVLAWEPSLHFPSSLKRAIVLLCEKDRIARSLPKIFFIFRLHENGQAYCDTTQLLKGNLVIHINAKSAETRSKLFWFGLMAHEITHLFQDYQTAIIKNNYAAERRLASLLRDEVEGVHKDLREFFFHFLRGLLIEGVAQYYQSLKQQYIVFSEEEFKRIYLEFLVEAKDIKGGIDSALADAREFDPQNGTLRLSRSFSKKIDKSMYHFGYHMVYTILFVDHKTNFEQILRFQPFEFIRKYEECMKIKGLQPIISVSSGDGILDYKTILARLTVAVRELKRNPRK